LGAAAVEVNQVFNFCNEAALLAATRTDLKRKWFTGLEVDCPSQRRLALSGR